MKKELSKQGITFESLKNITQEITEKEIVCEDWIPSIEDIEREIKPNFAQFAVFVYWILETADFTQFENGEEIRKKLLDLFLLNVNIKDLDENQFFISSMKDVDVSEVDSIDTSCDEEIANSPTLYERLVYLNLQMEYLENKRKEELLASIKESESVEELDELEKINKTEETE